MGGGNYYDIRSLYGIPSGCKIILYIGNLCYRKNQKQMVDAFMLLPETIAKDCYVLFLGREIESDYNLIEYVKQKKYSNQFVICGNIDKENVHYFYEQANGVALLSMSEGFGLSLIEGMHWGLPSVTFEDMDAFEDVYNPLAMVGLDEKTDERVAAGIIELLTRQWDKQAIINWSKNFELPNMTQKYIRCYKQL